MCVDAERAPAVTGRLSGTWNVNLCDRKALHLTASPIRSHGDKEREGARQQRGGAQDSL